MEDQRVDCNEKFKQSYETFVQGASYKEASCFDHAYGCAPLLDEESLPEQRALVLFYRAPEHGQAAA